MLCAVLEACKFFLGSWPTRFMELEMATAALYCQSEGGEVDAVDRSQVLSRSFEYIAEKM